MSYIFFSLFSCCCTRSKIAYLDKNSIIFSNYCDTNTLSSNMNNLENVIKTTSMNNLQHLHLIKNQLNVCKYADSELEYDMQNHIPNFSIRPKKMPRYSDIQKYICDIQNKVLLEESINKSVVLMKSIILTCDDNNQRIHLPMGTILNVISTINNWLYIETPNNAKGYIDQKVCIPLGVLSPLQSGTSKETASLRKTPINNTISVLSEELTLPNHNSNENFSFSESTFDFIYLQILRSNEKIFSPMLNNYSSQNGKSIALIIKTDYNSTTKDTLSVKKGETVSLIHCCVKGWYWVKKENNVEGFIPSITASYCFT